MAECPECGTEVDGKPGKVVRCPECNARVRIPDEDRPKVAAKPVKATAKAGAKKDAAKKAPPAEEEMYGFTQEEDLTVVRQRNEEAEKKKAEEKAAKEKPVIEVRRKNIGDLRVWAKIDKAMIWFLCGVVAWGLAHLLYGLILFIGMVQGPDYAGPVVTKLISPEQPPMELGAGDALDRPSFVIAMLGGMSVTGVTLALFIIVQIVGWIRAGLWVTGYAIAWPAAPRDVGGRGQLIALYCLAAFNFLTAFFLVFLPFVGAYRYCVMPWSAAELGMAEFNMDRSFPLHLFWAFSPFWESLLAFVLMVALYMEPILIAYFIWSVAATIKDEPLEASAVSAITFGFSVMFLHLVYQLFAMAGNSPVLVQVLRVLYLLWYCALIVYLLRMVAAITKCRETFNFYFHPDQD